MERSNNKNEKSNLISNIEEDGKMGSVVGVHESMICTYMRNYKIFFYVKKVLTAD